VIKELLFAVVDNLFACLVSNARRRGRCIVSTPIPTIAALAAYPVEAENLESSLPEEVGERQDAQ
jgi:hypothetical protein